MHAILAFEAGCRDPALLLSSADEPPTCKQEEFRVLSGGQSENATMQLPFGL